jgi:hypothetical protein
VQLGRLAPAELSADVEQGRQIWRFLLGPLTMTVFSRNFPVERLTDAVLKENVWLCDLLRRWHPAGDAIGKPTEQEGVEHLRLAIRDGYVNFYRAGQSVANVGFNGGRQLHAKIHNKYVYGKDGSGQSYVKLTSTGLPERGTQQFIRYDAARLGEWVSEASRHSGAEKRFVDLIVGHNRNVIDLEVGLPAYSKIPEERRAPRMDLVALELVDDQWQIVFWEAKLVTNAEARCQGADDPRVIGQLKKYTDWICHENHRDLVAQEYQRVCRLLVKLHDVARDLPADVADLGPGILAVAAPRAPLPLIDDKPRLLIDDRMRNVAFKENGHLKKLRDSGLHVQMVRGLDQMTLDRLA